MAHQYFAPPPVRHDSALYTPAASPRAHEDEADLLCDFEQSIFIFPNPTSTNETRKDLSICTDVGRSDAMASAARRGRRLSSTTESTNWELLSARSTSVDTALRSPLIELWEITDDEEGVAEDERQVPSVASTFRAQASARSPQRARPPSRHARRCPLDKTPSNAFTYADGRFQLRRPSVSRSRVRRRNVDRRGGAGGGRRKSASLPRSPARSTFMSPASSRLPLLSILSALFGIEDATLRLLASPTNTSTPSLFPGPRLHRAEDVLDEKRMKPLDGSETTTLKHGVDATIDSSLRSDNAFALPAFSFPSIWGLVDIMNKTSRKVPSAQL